MHEAETRALGRAVLLLALISVVRWGWAARWSAPPSGGETVLADLAAESREAADEAARRDTPLGEGERIDPNRADEVELDRLPGIGPATAGAIVSARDDGMVFRTPEDLLDVRGIGPATLSRIRGLLSLRNPPVVGSARSAGSAVAGRIPHPAPVVDVNTADPEALQSLPGIGPALAERILVARREQAFASLDDLVRVRGIGPATVERLRQRATVVGSVR